MGILKKLFLVTSFMCLYSAAHADISRTAGGAITVNVFTGSSPINAANQGSWINGIQVSTINCGANLTCTNAGNGMLTITGSAAGGGSSGASSLSISTGSPSAANVISSPTANINLSSGSFLIQATGGSTAYITLNFSSVTAQGFIDTVTAIIALYATVNSSNTAWHVFADTAQVKIQGIALSTGVLRTDVAASTNVLASFFSTSLTTTVGQADWNIAKSTNDSDHVFFRVVFTSNASMNDAQNSSAAVTNANLTLSSTTLANRAATLVAFSNGTRKGDFTALDLSGTAVQSFTCSGTTCTLVLTAGAAASGGAAALRIEPAQVTISTMFLSPDDFNTRNGTLISTVTVKDSSGPWSASQRFSASSTTFDNGVNISSTTGYVRYGDSFGLKASTYNPIVYVGTEGSSVHTSSSGALLTLENSLLPSASMGTSPTFRFLVHGDDVAGGFTDLPAWWDFGSRTIATTYNVANNIFSFSGTGGTPVWAADNSSHFHFYPTQGTTGNFSGVLTRYFSIGNDLFYLTSTGEMFQGALAYSTQRSTADATIVQNAGFSAASGTVISLATATFKNAYDAFTSSTQKQITDALNFSASSAATLNTSTDAIKSRIDIAFSTIQKQMGDSFTFAAGSAAILNTSTNNLVTALFTTATALNTETVAVQGATTAVANMIAIATGSAAGSLYNTPHVWVSQTISSGVVVSSLNVMDVVVSSKGVLTASVTTQALNVSGSTITLGGAQTTGLFSLVFASGGANVGDRMIATQVNGTNIVMGFGKAVTPGTGGSVAGVSGGFTFDGTVATAFSTISAQTPYGLAPIATGGSSVSSFTILGATNPYRMISLPAPTWMGFNPSSSSRSNSGFALSIATIGYNVPGKIVQQFNAPNSTPSFAYADVDMPCSWDGSTISYQVSYFASTGTASAGTAGTANTIWSLGAMALSSGTASFQAITSSVSVVGTFVSSYTHINTPVSAGLQVLGAPAPCSTVEFMLSAFGGGFPGLPLMTTVKIWYREATFDGRPR